MMLQTQHDQAFKQPGTSSSTTLAMVDEGEKQQKDTCFLSLDNQVEWPIFAVHLLCEM